VLSQKNDQGDEQPIAFMRKNIRDSELNYTITKKQAYYLVKSLKHFQTYVRYNKIIAFVPYPIVNDVLSQQDCLGSRGKWVSQMMEYDLEINPTKIIKIQGLEKMMTESNQEAIEVGQNDQFNIIVSDIENNEWYSHIIYYLKKLTCPDHLVEHKRRALRVKDMKYFLIENGLRWRNPDEVILICVDKEEVDKLIIKLHARHCGGHFAARTTAHKILRAGYYWPTIFSDTHRYVRDC
jgi:hypothetical protein